MSNWPLLQSTLNLEGFDLAAFLLSAIVAIVAVGFAVDYLLGRQGMGPYWNSLYAALAPTPDSACTTGGFDPIAPMNLI